MLFEKFRRSLWALMVIATSASAEYYGYEVDLCGSIYHVNRMNYSEDNVLIARGSRISLPANETESGGAFGFRIKEIDRGIVGGSNIIVYSRTNTMADEMPEFVILKLLAINGNLLQFRALGDDLRYSILPYSDEEWVRVRNTPIQELIENTKQNKMPLVDALHVAFEEARRNFGTQGSVLDVGVFPIAKNEYHVLRYSHSWHFVLKIDVADKDNDRVQVYYNLHIVFDDGRVERGRTKLGESH